MPAVTAAAPALAPGWPIELLGVSAAARRLRDLARDLARSARPVLIVAPPGFNAGAVAHAIHLLGGQAGPLVTVDCAAEGPETEGILFGAAGVRRGRPDLLEPVSPDSRLAGAQGGTLVLLSAHDLPVSAQTRLARVLRDGEVRMNGGPRAVRLSLRFIAASELPLEREVRHGRFSPDLLKRFAARQVTLVPLRDRREDVAAITLALMDRAAAESGRLPREFTHAALALLAALGWAGNIAELDSLVRQLAGQAVTAPIRVEDVLEVVDPGAVASVTAPRASLREARRRFEREYIAAVLRHSGWRMDQAARLLGIQRTNLYRKARQLGISRRANGGE